MLYWNPINDLYGPKDQIRCTFSLIFLIRKWWLILSAYSWAGLDTVSGLHQPGIEPGFYNWQTWWCDSSSRTCGSFIQSCNFHSPIILALESHHWYTGFPEWLFFLAFSPWSRQTPWIFNNWLHTISILQLQNFIYLVGKILYIKSKFKFKLENFDIFDFETFFSPIKKFGAWLKALNFVVLKWSQALANLSSAYHHFR